MKKTNYYIIGLAVLAALIAGYHFYAANQAEDQIRVLIEEQTAGNSSISVKYSSVEVTPFTGKVIFRDLTVIQGDHIERAQQFTVDLNYFDVLTFYIGGTEYALEHLYRAEALLLKPSYVNKSNLQQISSDSLHIHFEGQALDGIRAAVTDTFFSERQTIQAEGSGLRYQLPETLVAGLEVNTFRYDGTIAGGEKFFWSEGRHEVVMDSLTWKPSEAFQSKYGFFVKGFGYTTDAIPFQSARFQSSPQPQSDMLLVKSELESELALISVNGDVRPQQPLGTSQLRNTSISLSNFSESFTRVLENIEQLLSISLPRNEESGITIPIKGTLSDPVLVQ